MAGLAGIKTCTEQDSELSEPAKMTVPFFFCIVAYFIQQKVQSDRYPFIPWVGIGSAVFCFQIRRGGQSLWPGGVLEVSALIGEHARHASPPQCA